MLTIEKRIVDIAHKYRDSESALYQEFNGDIYFTIDKCRIFRIPEKRFMKYCSMDLWNLYEENDMLAGLFINDSEYTNEIIKADVVKHNNHVLQQFIDRSAHWSVKKIKTPDKCRIKHVAMKYLRQFTNRHTHYYEPDRAGESWKTPLFLENDGYTYLMILPVVC